MRENPPAIDVIGILINSFCRKGLHKALREDIHTQIHF